MRISGWIFKHLSRVKYCSADKQIKQTILIKRNEECGFYFSILFSGQNCPFVLLVLTGQLEDLQAALLASIMDVIGLRHGQSDLSNSLSWSDGLNRLHCHSRGKHLLSLLGQNAKDAGQDMAKVSSSVSLSICSFIVGCPSL